MATYLESSTPFIICCSEPAAMGHIFLLFMVLRTLGLYFAHSVLEPISKLSHEGIKDMNFAHCAVWAKPQKLYLEPFQQLNHHVISQEFARHPTLAATTRFFPVHFHRAFFESQKQN